MGKEIIDQTQMEKVSLLTPKKRILPIIVFSQFLCTSLWFAGNAVLNNLITHFNLNQGILGPMTSSVQLGFIAGTLVFAVFTISDRFSPSKVFATSAFLGAIFNLGIIWNGNSIGTLLTLRFLTGFCLAGIYPIGMKIAADYFDKGLGKSLGFLVGALVLGTALPHLLKEFTTTISWKPVLICTSSFAVFGGSLMVFFVPDGPYRKASLNLDVSSFLNVFKHQEFRSVALGYFGHMWELYAFWAFVPVILKTYTTIHPNTTFQIPLLSFAIIGIGSISCILGGYLSERFGTKTTAFTALFLSCLCCLISPFVFLTETQWLFVLFLIFWGMVVIADSPLFSSLVAQNAPSQTKGTALTIVNCIGFAITIISIQLLNRMTETIAIKYIYLALALWPIFGLVALTKKAVSSKLFKHFID